MESSNLCRRSMHAIVQTRIVKVMKMVLVVINVRVWKAKVSCQLTEVRVSVDLIATPALVCVELYSRNTIVRRLLRGS